MRQWQVLVLMVVAGSLGAQSMADRDPLEVREQINARCMAVEAPVWEVGSVEERATDAGTPLRIYRPGEGRHPVVLLIHGGAWVGGNLETHDNLARFLCAQTRAVVVSVGYTNAPEGKFPQQLDECWEALELAQGLSERIAVVGDSSGGNMAAALCMMARDRGGPPIDLQVLINPAPDLSCQGTLEAQGEGLDILRWQATMYVRDAEEVYHPYVSPLLAEDLSGLPPALVLVAELDELRADGERFAERLLAAGVPTEIYCQLGAKHLAGDGARASDVAIESLNVAVTALRKPLGHSG